MKRYEELDSLRGIAALSVVGVHFLNIFISNITTNILEFGPLRLFFAGGEGVLLFFVLSGFVLYLPFSRGEKVNYKDFLTRRFFRIYTPYIMATFIALLGSLFIYQGKISGLSDWFNDRWNDPLNPDVLIGHILLIGSFNNAELNPVIWSLVHEMRISIIFPFLAYFVYKTDWKILLGSSAGVLFFSVLVYLFIDLIPESLTMTLYYMHMFLIGAILAKYKDPLIFVLRKLSNKIKAGIFLVGFAFYLYAKPAYILKVTLRLELDSFYQGLIDNLFTVAGVGIFILLALSSNRVSKLLLNKYINYIGKVSYSLYLYHCIALLMTVHLLADFLPVSICIIIALLLSFVMTKISYDFIEVPANNFGKKLVGRRKLSQIKKKTIQSHPYS